MREKGNAVAAITASKRRLARTGRARILVEFPFNLLQRAEDAAAKLGKSRSALIRTAVEHLEEMDKKKLEMELIAAYSANALMNIALGREFTHADNED